MIHWDQIVSTWTKLCGRLMLFLFFYCLPQVLVVGIVGLLLVVFCAKCDCKGVGLVCAPSSKKKMALTCSGLGAAHPRRCCSSMPDSGRLDGRRSSVEDDPSSSAVFDFRSLESSCVCGRENAVGGRSYQTTTCDDPVADRR
jgi:hypothetical protein